MANFVATIGLCSALVSTGTSTLTPERLWEIPRVSGVEASRDGSLLAFVLSSHRTDTTEADIWLAERESGRLRQLTSDPAADTQPRFAADGRSLYFLSARGGKPNQLHRIAVDGGEAEALTAFPLAITRYAPLDDGRVVLEIAVYADLDIDWVATAKRQAELEADATQVKASENRLWRYWDRYLTGGTQPRLYLRAVDGTLTAIEPGFSRLTNPDGFEWSVDPRGSSLVYSASSTAPPYQTLDFDLYHVDLASGAIRHYPSPTATDETKPVVAVDGLRVLYAATTRAGNPADLNHLMERRLDGSEAWPRVPDQQLPISEFRYTGRGDEVVLTQEARGRVHLHRQRAAAAPLERIVEGGAISGIAPCGRACVGYTRQDLSTPAELAIIEGQRSRTLTRIAESALSGVQIGKVADLDLPGADGPVQTFVIFPPNYDRKRRYPLLLLAHGGPFSAWLDAYSYRWNPHVFAARGYIVAMPNFSGSTGFGQAFADRLVGNHGGPAAADMRAVTDALARRDDIDGERMAIAGGSYGGYLTLLITGLTSRFKAAINHAGVFDLSLQFGSDSAYTRDQSYGDAPWTDPVRLDTWSPSRCVPQMATPTLHLHGQLDYRVPYLHAVNAHGALTGKGVPSRIVVFPKENHWILRRSASLRWHQEYFDWLDRWVQPGPAPTQWGDRCG